VSGLVVLFPFGNLGFGFELPSSFVEGRATFVVEFLIVYEDGMREDGRRNHEININVSGL